jgi:hypothetical protein
MLNLPHIYHYVNPKTQLWSHGETLATTETAVADTYLELSFAPEAGILLGGHATGNIQLRIHKTNWQAYDELNDYSYSGSASFAESQQVTLYHNGQLIWGEEPTDSGSVSGVTSTPQPTSPPNSPAPTNTPVPTTIPPTAAPSPTQTPPAAGSSPEPTTLPPTTSGIRAQYRTFDADPFNNNLQPQLQLVNDSSSAIPLSELRLRYWFTDVETAVSIAHCDYAVVGNDKITAVTGNIGTQHYVDVTFSVAAGDLKAGSSSGEIFLRIHHNNWTPHNESDDYSFSSGQTNLIDWQKVTLYHHNQLIWGIEP